MPTDSTFSLAALQTKDGKGVAKGETAEEFQDVMREIAKNVKALQADHPSWRASGAIYSFDNAVCHTRADLSFLEGDLLGIPPRSPDIHKVIEHPFHPVKAAFHHAFGRRRNVKSLKQAMNLLQQIVYEVVTPESISKDCSTIPATLASIIKNGGGWADPGLR